MGIYKILGMSKEEIEYRVKRTHILHLVSEAILPYFKNSIVLAFEGIERDSIKNDRNKEFENGFVIEAFNLNFFVLVVTESQLDYYSQNYTIDHNKYGSNEDTIVDEDSQICLLIPYHNLDRTDKTNQHLEEVSNNIKSQIDYVIKSLYGETK